MCVLNILFGTDSFFVCRNLEWGLLQCYAHFSVHISIADCARLGLCHSLPTGRQLHHWAVLAQLQPRICRQQLGRGLERPWHQVLCGLWRSALLEAPWPCKFFGIWPQASFWNMISEIWSEIKLCQQVSITKFKLKKYGVPADSFNGVYLR